MPQSSIHYAIGRLSALEKDVLDLPRLERLIQAPSVADARRSLSEIGWPEDADVEKGAREHLRKACDLVKSLSPDPAVTDCFLLRYDVRNLKALLKARCLHEEAEDLSPCGTLAPELLRRAVAERSYGWLPAEFRSALEGLEKRLAARVDPLDIDVTLDKALYARVFALLPPDRKHAQAYFRRRVDLLNLLMALRSAHAGKPPNFLSGILIPSGSVAPGAWARAYGKPERLPLLIRRHGPRVYAAAVSAFTDAGKLPLLEKEAEDSLTGLYRPFRRAIDREERLAGYLLMREREADAVRLVMAGKANRFSPETLRERLRGLYAG